MKSIRDLWLHFEGKEMKVYFCKRSYNSLDRSLVSFLLSSRSFKMGRREGVENWYPREVYLWSFIQVLSLNFLHSAAWLWGWGYEDHTSKIFLPVFQLDSARDRHCEGDWRGGEEISPASNSFSISAQTGSKDSSTSLLVPCRTPLGPGHSHATLRSPSCPSTSVRHPTLPSQHL